MHTHTRTHTRAHTHTHSVQTDRGERQFCCLTDIFGKEKCLEFAFEGRESTQHSPHVLGEIVPCPDMGTEGCEV